MIPSDYRLETVAQGLVERLDSARRSYEGAEEAREGFERIARRHLDQVAAEWRALGWSERPEAHEAFLREEILTTFLPRFHRSAMEIGEAERSGYGVGALAQPVGRLGLAAGTLLFLWFVLLRLVVYPVVWPLMLVVLSVPFVPDLLRTLVQRRYHAQLLELLHDMRRIQEQSLAYDGGPDALDEELARDPIEEARRAARAQRDAQEGRERR